MSSKNSAFIAGFIKLSLTVLIVCCAIAAREETIDPALADQYFQEARAICSKDGGRLWGISLDGPLLFVDPRTRSVVASQSDREGRLTAKGNVFIGKLPETENIANTSTRWAGVKWTMVVWPLPENKQSRARLMLHELFHRIQDEISLPGANPSNDHLDGLEGRILLRLEWRALKHALAFPAERRRAVEDALVFRALRREQFRGAAEMERGLEMNEGLAEYTGVSLCGKTMPEITAHLRAQLEAYDKRPSFARSFAYMSGPAYGVLLDETGRTWRKNLTSQDDLGLMLQKALSITLPGNLKEESEKRGLRYDGELLRAEETGRHEERKKRIAEYRKRFVEGPLLILPLSDEVQYSFDPYNIETLEGQGTVYPKLRVSDAWGVLEVSGGALMIRDGARVARVHVSAPEDAARRPLAGTGWELKLTGGWRLVRSERAGDYTLKKED